MTLSPSSNTILVTGGAGFIGSNFVRLCLTKKKANVVVIDKLTYAGHRENLSDVASLSGYNFIQADIADTTKMDSVLKDARPFAVVNFAAETHVDRSIDEPQAFLKTNVEGTFCLLESARRYWLELDAKAKKQFRFLHVSTDEVYGSLAKPRRAAESFPFEPNSPYAASKAAADHFVRSSFATFGLPTLVTHASNNFGPYQFPEKLIPLMIMNAMEGKPLPVYGDGKNIREWMYVEDHCEGLWKVLKSGRPGERYNIGSGCDSTNVDLVKLICEILESKKPARDNPALVSRGVARYDRLIQFVVDRPGHDRRYALNSGKMKKLGWSARKSFRAALGKTIDWYLNRRDWCDAVQKNTYNRERLGLSQ